MLELICFVLLGVAVSACTSRANPPIVVKIGVIAPFEGVGRDLGYGVLSAVKQELEAGNTAGSLGAYRVALVALNDDLDPATTAAQAQALAQDEDVLAVIGPWSGATAEAALPILRETGLSILPAALGQDTTNGVFSLCPSPDVFANDILASAHDRVDLPVVVAGPDNSLRRALFRSKPDLLVVSDSLPSPCPADSPDACVAIYTGDAAHAAEALVRWRASGWSGPFLVGPDAGRPWLIPLAGSAAEGVRAAVCGELRDPAEIQDASFAAATVLAGTGTRAVLSALSQLISDREQPSRRNVVEALSAEEPQARSAWIEVMGDRWVSVRE